LQNSHNNIYIKGQEKGVFGGFRAKRGDKIKKQAIHRGRLALLTLKISTLLITVIFRPSQAKHYAINVLNLVL